MRSLKLRSLLLRKEKPDFKEYHKQCLAPAVRFEYKDQPDLDSKDELMQACLHPGDWA